MPSWSEVTDTPKGQNRGNLQHSFSQGTQRYMKHLGSRALSSALFLRKELRKKKRLFPKFLIILLRDFVPHTAAVRKQD